MATVATVAEREIEKTGQRTREALELEDNMQFRIWYALVRYVTPVAVLIVFVYNLG